MSGSDCGHIFIWSKESGEIVQMLKGDESVVSSQNPKSQTLNLTPCGKNAHMLMCDESVVSFLKKLKPYTLNPKP